MYKDLGMVAQSLYAELFDQVLSEEIMEGVGNLSGNFFKKTVKNNDYWYYGYRDLDSKVKMIYVGPDSERIRILVEGFQKNKRESNSKSMSSACASLGFSPLLPKHFKIVKKLSEYGLFRAGGVLVGTHAFLAYGNMFGVKWSHGSKTLDLDFAHPGNNVSMAMPSNIKIDAHKAIESLEMGLVPITEFNGKTGPQYRNQSDKELRIDFLTPMTRDGDPVHIENLNVSLEPLKFMEFSLESPVQACLISKSGSCIVNVPHPARFAIHKLIVFGERSISEQAKSEKDIVQAASIVRWMLDHDRQQDIVDAFTDASTRGPGWKKRLDQGIAAMLRRYPMKESKEIFGVESKLKPAGFS